MALDREFSSPAELLAHYAAVRRRIEGAGRSPRPPAKPAPKTHQFGEGFTSLAEVRKVQAAAEEERARRHDAAIEAQREAFRAATAGVTSDRPSPKWLISYIAWWHGVSVEEVIGPSRKQPIVQVRFDCYAAVYEHHWERGLTWLGKQFGGRDHTTCLHGLRKRNVRLMRQKTGAGA